MKKRNLYFTNRKEYCRRQKIRKGRIRLIKKAKKEKYYKELREEIEEVTNYRLEDTRKYIRAELGVIKAITGDLNIWYPIKDCYGFPNPALHKIFDQLEDRVRTFVLSRYCYSKSIHDELKHMPKSKEAYGKERSAYLHKVCTEFRGMAMALKEYFPNGSWQEPLQDLLIKLSDEFLDKAHKGLKGLVVK